LKYYDFIVKGRIFGSIEGIETVEQSEQVLLGTEDSSE